MLLLMLCIHLWIADISCESLRPRAVSPFASAPLSTTTGVVQSPWNNSTLWANTTGEHAQSSQSVLTTTSNGDSHFQGSGSTSAHFAAPSDSLMGTVGFPSTEPSLHSSPVSQYSSDGTSSPISIATAANDTQGDRTTTPGPDSYFTPGTSNPSSEKPSSLASSTENPLSKNIALPTAKASAGIYSFGNSSITSRPTINTGSYAVTAVNRSPSRNPVPLSTNTGHYHTTADELTAPKVSGDSGSRESNRFSSYARVNTTSHSTRGTLHSPSGSPSPSQVTIINNSSTGPRSSAARASSSIGARINSSVSLSASGHSSDHAFTAANTPRNDSASLSSATGKYPQSDHPLSPAKITGATSSRGNSSETFDGRGSSAGLARTRAALIPYSSSRLLPNITLQPFSSGIPSGRYYPQGNSSVIKHSSTNATQLPTTETTVSSYTVSGTIHLPANRSIFLPMSTTGAIRSPWNGSMLLANATGRHLPSQTSPPKLKLGGENSLSSNNATWYQEQCMLWDDSCKGNETLALQNFFNNSGSISSIFYGPHCIWSLDPQCQPWFLPQENRIELLNWLRNPKCVQRFNQYHEEHPEDSPWTWHGRAFTGMATETVDWKAMATTTPGVGCCGQCLIQGGNVDVYYWKDEHANTECEHVIGTSFNDPLAGILTTDARGYQYWKDPENLRKGHVTSQSNAALPPPMALGGPMDPFFAYTDAWAQSYIFKVYPPSIASQIYSDYGHHGGHGHYDGKDAHGHKLRESLVSGFENAVSDQVKPSPVSRNGASSAPQSTAELHRREVSHPITSAATQQAGGKEATIGDFTCTSPSVCVGFSQIYAQDGCGGLSAAQDQVISYTILPFAPGELSTIRRPAWERGNTPNSLIKPFDFADMPCPPKDVMSAVHYEPKLGHPYRPVLFPPSKLNSLKPGWAGCTLEPAMFDGVDPPRSLKPSESLVPKESLSAAAPAAGDPQAKQTLAPGQPLVKSQPYQTAVPVSSNPPNSPSSSNQDSSAQFDPSTPNAGGPPAPIQSSASQVQVNTPNDPHKVSPDPYNPASGVPGSLGDSPITPATNLAPNGVGPNPPTAATPPTYAAPINYPADGGSPAQVSPNPSIVAGGPPTGVLPPTSDGAGQPGPGEVNSPADISPNQVAQIHSNLSSTNQGTTNQGATNQDTPSQGIPDQDTSNHGSQNHDTTSQTTDSQNSNSESNYNQGIPATKDNVVNVSPDQVAQVNSILSSNGQPSTSNDVPNGQSNPGDPVHKLAPDQVQQIHSVLATGPKANPTTGSDPSNISPEQAAQINNIVNTDAKGQSNPGQSFPSVSPDQLSQIKSVVGPIGNGQLSGGGSPEQSSNQGGQKDPAMRTDGNGDPVPNNGPSGLSPTEVDRVISILGANGNGQPASTFDPANISPDQAAQIKSVLNSDTRGQESQGGASSQPGLHGQPPFGESPSPVLVGGLPMSKGADGGVVIGQTTISPGAQATIDGHVVSAGASHVVVDHGNTYAIPTKAGGVVETPQNENAPVLVGGQSLVKGADGGLVIGGNPLTPGSQTTIQGHVISAGPSNAIVDGSSYPLPSDVGETMQRESQGDKPVLVGGQPIVKAGNGGVMVGGDTVAPGTHTTVNGHVISAGPSDVNVDGSTYTLPPSTGDVVKAAAAPQQNFPVLLWGQPLVKSPDGSVAIGGTTIPPGTKTTVNGHVISVGSSNVEVDGTSYALPPTAGTVVKPASAQGQGSPIQIDGQPLVKAVDGGVIIGGSTTLAPGHQTTISGHIISAGATDVMIDGSAYPMPTNPGGLVQSSTNQQEGSPILLDGKPLIKAANGGLVVDGSTIIAPGAQSTVKGHVISAGPTGVVIDGTATYPLPSNAGETVHASPSSLMTPAPVLVGGKTLVKSPNGGIVIDGSTTLAPGAQTTINGHIISVGSSAIMIDGSSTSPLDTLPIPAPVLINGQSLIKATNGGLVIGSITIPPGTQTTLNGHTISVGSSNVIVDGSSTLTLPSTAGETVMLGGIMASTTQQLSSRTSNNATPLPAFMTAASKTLLRSVSSHGTLVSIATIVEPVSAPNLMTGSAASGVTGAKKKSAGCALSIEFMGWSLTIILTSTMMMMGLGTL